MCLVDENQYNYSTMPNVPTINWQQGTMNCWLAFYKTEVSWSDINIISIAGGRIFS